MIPTMRVTEKGQVTIPQAIREAAGFLPQYFSVQRCYNINQAGCGNVPTYLCNSLNKPQR